MKLLLILLVFNFKSFASEWEETCFDQGEKYGLYLEARIHPHCFDVYKTRANPRAKITHEEKGLTFVGYKNIIFIKTQDYLYKISGPQSRLEDIHALVYDEENHRLIALVNSPKQIFTFHLKSGGNISPIRVIESKELAEAVDLSLSLDYEFIEVHLPYRDESLRFKRKACIHSRDPELISRPSP